MKRNQIAIADFFFFVLNKVYTNKMKQVIRTCKTLIQNTDTDRQCT